MVKASDVRVGTLVFGRGRRAALLLGLLTSLLAGCGPAVEIGGDASTGDPSPTGASSTGVSPTTSVPPTTVDPSGVDVTSGTGSSGPSATSSTTEDTVGSQFIIDPDGGSLSGCSLFEQSCVRGEKCTIWANDGGNAWNATRCVPVDRAPDGPAEPCTVEDSGVSGLDSCDVGSVCWDVDPDTLDGTCVSFCAGSEDAPLCEDGLRCIGNNLFFLCLPNCDPLVQDCNEGDACYVIEDTTECASDTSDDSGAAFDTCAFANACDPGLNCTDEEIVGLCDEGAEACCTPFCDMQDTTCPEGTQCISAFAEGMVPPGYEDVGVCGQDPV
jgi:hypothetical protein